MGQNFLVFNLVCLDDMDGKDGKFFNKVTVGRRWERE